MEENNQDYIGMLWKKASENGYKQNEDYLRDKLMNDEEYRRLFHEKIQSQGYKPDYNEFSSRLGLEQQVQQPAPRVDVSDVEAQQQPESTILPENVGVDELRKRRQSIQTELDSDTEMNPMTISQRKLYEQQLKDIDRDIDKELHAKYDFSIENATAMKERNEALGAEVEKVLASANKDLQEMEAEHNGIGTRYTRQQYDRLVKLMMSDTDKAIRKLEDPDDPFSRLKLTKEEVDGLKSLAEERKKGREYMEEYAKTEEYRQQFLPMLEEEENKRKEQKSALVDEYSNYTVEKLKESIQSGDFSRYFTPVSMKDGKPKLTLDWLMPGTSLVKDLLWDRNQSEMLYAMHNIEQASKEADMERRRLEGKDIPVVTGLLHGVDWRGLNPLVDLRDATVQLGLSQKTKNGEELSGLEQEVMQTLDDKAKADMLYGNNYTVWDRLGTQLPEQLMFTLSFILSGGITGATEAGEKVAAKAALKAAARRAERGATGKFGTFVAEKVVPKTLGMATGATMQTFASPISWPSIAADFEKRYAGDVYYDKDGNLHVFDNGVSAPKALYQAAASAWIENFTEFAGENITKTAKLVDSKLLDVSGAVDDLMKKTGMKRIYDVVSNPIPGNLGKLAQKGSNLEEFSEEILGSIMNALFATDQKAGQSYSESVKESVSNAFSQDQLLETFLSCTLTGMVLGGGGMARNAIATRDQRKAINRQVETSRAILSKVNGIDIDELDNQIENSEIKDLSKWMKQQSDANGWSADEQGAVISYVLGKTQQTMMRFNDESAIQQEMEELRKQAESMRNVDDGTIYNAMWDDGSGTEQPVNIVSGRVRYNTNEDGSMSFDPYTSSGMLIVRLPDGTMKQVSSRSIKSLESQTTVDELLEAQGNTVPQAMRRQFEEDGMAVPTVESVWGGAPMPGVTALNNGKLVYIGNDNGEYVFSNKDEATKKDMPEVRLSERQMVEIGLGAKIDDAIARGDMEAKLEADNDMDFLRKMDEASEEVTEKKMWDYVTHLAASRVKTDEEGNVVFEDGNVGAYAAYLLARSNGAHDVAMAEIRKAIEARQAQLALVETVQGIDPDGNITSLQATTAEAMDHLLAIDFYQKALRNLEQKKASDENVQAAAVSEVEEDRNEETANTPVSQMEVGQQFPVEWKGQPAMATVMGKDADGRSVVTVRDMDGEDIEAGIDDWSDQQWESVRQKPQADEQAPQQEPQPTPVQPTPTPQGPAPTAQPVSQNETHEPAPIPSTSDVTPSMEFPRDEEGNIDYEQITDPYVYAAAVREEFGYDALEFVNALIDGEEAILAETPKIKDTVKRFRQQRESKARLERFKKVRDIITAPQEGMQPTEQQTAEGPVEVTEQPTSEAPTEEAPVEQPTEEASTEQPTEEAPDETAGVPDWVDDTAASARKRGFRMVNGERVDRQEPISGVEGNEVEVKFSDTEKPKGKWKVVEAESLQPSHLNKRRNPRFFITEAQPKERKDSVSDDASTKIAKDINPEEVMQGVTAYSGSPVINSRGEVIQGNNRTIGLQKMYESYPESQEKYKQALMDKAEQMGLDKEAIGKMRHPVLVRSVDVDDETAIKLGQKTSQDTESGGVQRMGASQVRNSLGDKYARLVEMLFADTEENEGLGEAIARNGVTALKYLWEQKAINDTQYQSALNGKELTPEAKEDFRNIIMESLFEGGSDGLRQAFNLLPSRSQNAILQTIYRDSKNIDENKIKGDVQQAIMAFGELMGFADFVTAKDQKSVDSAVETWKNQGNMFSGDTNSGKYSNFALDLAKKFKYMTLKGQRSLFNELYDKLQGVASEGLSMFEEVQKLGLVEAIKAVYGIDYQKRQTKKENGVSGSNDVAVNDGVGEEGQRGDEGSAESGEREKGGERTSDSGTGNQRPGGTREENQGGEREITLDEIRNAWENGFDGVDEETLDTYYQWLLKNANDEESNRILDDMNDLLGIEDEAEEQEEQEEETPTNEEPKPKQEKKTKEQLEQERRNDILSLKDPLTEEEIRNSSEDEIIKENALSYLNGDRGVMAANCYLIIYDDVRNVTTGAERSGSTTDQPQLDAEDNGDKEPGESGQGGRGTGELGGEPSVAGRPGDSQEDNNGGVADTDGEGSLQEVEGDKPQKPDNQSANSTRRGGSRGNRGASVDGNGGREVGRNDSNANADDGGGNATDSLQDALDEFGDLLDDLTKENQAIRRRNRGILYANPIGANMSMEKLKIWAKLTVAGAKVGYELIKKGITKFADWSKQMNTLLSAKLTKAFGWDKNGIDQYILELWNSKLPIDGETHTVAEWASIMGKKKIREAISESKEVKADKQAKAENIEAKPADIDNINATLPFLLPEQRDDVLKAETQFFTEAHQDREHGYGKGYLFTNGTGTGKTYTGLGIIKRFAKMGKGRVLLVVPSEKKESDWINSGKNLLLDIHSLRDDKYWNDGKSSTQRSGSGIVVTTDAAFRENFELLKDNFDLVVYDESHRIMSSNDANSTRYLDHHFMLTLKDAEAATQRAIAVSPEMEEHRANAKEIDTILKALAKNERLKNKIESGNGTQSDLDKLLSEQEENDMRNRAQRLDFRNASIIADIESRKSEFEQNGKAFMDAKQPKVVFLSATPFNTVDSMKYAEGYIFSYPEGDKNGDLFKTQYFPSSFQSRHGKVQQSVVDAVQAEREEINFSERLQHELETMSGRVIENGYDYSRHFPTLTNEYATMFNEAVQRITSFAGYQPLYNAMYDTFLKGAGFAPALLETLKVALVIPRIKQHIAMGRKVVVFHRRRNSQEPPSPPFERMLNKAMMEATTPAQQAVVKSAVDQFRREFSKLLAYEQTLNYDMILKQFTDEFGDQVAFFNGDVKETEQENSEGEKKNISSIDAFNKHNGNTKIIVVQEASGKEGIDLHDTFGDEMRVEINLSLPQNPLTMLQIMGRIFRIGQKSNAVFEYPLIGLDFELMTFGSNMNQAVGTAENLALGDLSRGLRQALANGVLEHSGEVPLEGQGVGGVEYDRRSQEEGSYEKAMSDYYKAKAQKFPDTNATPEALGYKMVEWAGLEESDEVLEPSAGHGAIARYVPQGNSLTAIEPNISLMAGLQLRASGRTRDFKNQTFEALDIINKYNVVLMNSQHQGQSSGSADIVKAYQHLREGGRMVVVSNGDAVAMAKSRMPNAVLVGKVKLPSFTFGDNVADENGKVVNDYSNANVYIFDIASRNETREEAKKKYKEVDLSDAANIGELFAKLKDVKMPERTIDDAAIDTLNAGKTWPRFKKLSRVFWEEQSEFHDTFMRVLARTVGKKAYRYTKKLDIEYKALRENPRQAIRLYQDFKDSFNEYDELAKRYAEAEEQGEKVDKRRAEWTGEMADFCELSMRTILNVMRVNSEEQLIRLAEEHEANKARLLGETVQKMMENIGQTASSVLNNAAKEAGLKPYIEDYLNEPDDYYKRSTRGRLATSLRNAIYAELKRAYLEQQGYDWSDVDWNKKDEMQRLVEQEVDDYINRIDNGFDPLNVKESISDFEKEKEYDIEDIRQYFYNLIGDNKDLRTLFDKVVKVSSMFGYKFKFTDMLDNQPSVQGDTNFTGLIRLKDSLFRQGADKTKQANVILHEMIHSSLIYATLIRTYDKAKYPTLGLFMDNLAQRMSPEMNEAVDELLSLFNTLKIDKRFTRRDGGLEDYGAFTPDEMIAELANPMFRAKLKAKRVWKKVVNAIAKFFGAQTKEAEESDALVELEKILDKFLNNADKSLYNDVKNMLQLGGYANESLRYEDTVGGNNIELSTSSDLFEKYPTWLSGQTTDTGQHTTQITSTVKTYEHIGDWMKKQGMDGAKVLDASSGLGTGTFALRDMGFDVDDVEPYPSEKREAPTYTRYEDVDGEYDVVISNAVLNVIPDDWRADVLKSMADKVKVGGKLIINVRDAKSIESQKQKIELDSPSEILVTDSKGNIRAYQKGFTKQELKQYVESQLGEGWKVEIANEGNSGLKSGTAVVVTRTAGADELHYREIVENNGAMSRKESQSVAFEAVKTALSRAGFEVVEATDEDVERLKKSDARLMGSNGTVNGWFDKRNGKIYLTKSGLNAESAVHEYTHIWAEALQAFEPQLWDEIKGLLKGTPTWNEVASNPAYAKYGEDRMAEEVLAHISGRENSKRIEDEYKKMIDEAPTMADAAKAASLLNRLKEALRKFWTWCGQKLFKVKGKIDVDKVMDMVLADLVNGTNPFNPGSGRKKNEKQEESFEWDLESVNDFFNKRLMELDANRTQKDRVLRLGRPGTFLKAAGVKDADIEMEFDKFVKKSSDSYKSDHPFTAEDIQNLPMAINNPIAVFDSENGDKVILTELKKDGKNFIVAIRTVSRNRKGGDVLEINEISTLYPKKEKGVVNWILNNKASIYDKEKTLAWIEELRPHAETEQAKQELDSAANIVRNFNNPKFNEENISETELSFTPSQPQNRIADEYNRMTGANVDDVNSVKRGWEKFARDQFDGLRPLEQMQQLIEKALGRKLRDSEKAYELATQLTSKTGQQIDREQLSYIVPVLQNVTEAIKSLKREGYTTDEAYKMVTNYLLAKHGLERNAWFEKQGRKEGDYAGLRGLAENLGENPDDFKAVAERIVSEFEQDHDTKELWKSLKALSDRMLEISYNTGMIDKDTYEDLKKRHKYYVPLRGFADGTAADLFDYVTQSPHFQNIFKKATGRNSMADDPLANLMSMLHSAIVIGNQNEVMQKIYNLAVNSKSDLLRVTKPWYVYDDTTDTWEEKYPDIPEDATADEIDAIVKQFDADMQQKQQQGKAKRKLNRIDVGKKLLPYQAREHEMVAYIDGKRVVMHVAGNPLVAQAMNKSNTQQLNKVMQAIQTATRWYSSINTSWSPAFGPKNAMRDIRMMLFGAYVTGGIRKMWQSSKDIVKAGWALPRLLITGKMDGGLVKALGPQKAAQLEQWWNEFIENGGETGFTRTLNAEKAKGEVRDMIGHMLNGSKDGENRVRKYTIGLLEWIGRYSEDISRFAAYCQQRAQGESVLSSIQEAKNVTVNFNVKGGSDLAANMRAMYSFFNASMQGINRMRRLATEHPKRFAAGIAAMMLGGAVLPWLNMALFAMLGGDDDDWRKYEELSEYTANHNMIIYVGNHKFVSIPWSQELAPFNALGNIWFRQQMGWNKGKSVAEQWGDMFVDLSPVSVASGNKPGVGLVKTIMPSFTTPVWEALFNEDFTGSPLYKDNQWNKYDKGWEKAYEGKTSKSVIDASRWLDEKTGIDINPAIAEHLFSGVLGGMGRSGDKLLRYFTNGFQLQDAPFIRTMMFDSKKQGYIGAVQREYNRNTYEVLPEMKAKAEKADAMEFARLVNTEEYKIADVVSKYKTGKDLEGNKTGEVGIDKMEKEYKKVAGMSDGSEEYREQLEEIRNNITERKMEMLDEIQQIKYENSGDIRRYIMEAVKEAESDSKAKYERKHPKGQ